MRQANMILPTYTADVSGVCSALYELGGMTVMHDASGCNSTYNTHDEPRWYSTPSMVYISALTETEAMLGDDKRLIENVCQTALEQHPRFIALCGTPIPTMTGTDLPGLARLVERRTGIPSFGFPTTGMQDYLSGAGMALSGVARRFLPEKAQRTEKPSLNLLGVTPLDFSVTGNVQALRACCQENGFAVRGCWAMGDPFEMLMGAGGAWANLVVSAAGLPLARLLREKYGTPYVAGIPIGGRLAGTLFAALRQAAAGEAAGDPLAVSQEAGCRPALVVGEPVWALSMRAAMLAKGFTDVRAVTMLAPYPLPFLPCGRQAASEGEIFALAKTASFVAADPLYKPAVPQGVPFASFPHEACSGRIWRKDIPLFIGQDGDKALSV